MRTTGNGERERQSLGGEMRRLADSISLLVRNHMDLAKAELREEIRAMASDAAMGLAALPFLLAALLLLDAALAIGIGRWLGVGWGFAVVGALNAALGGLLGGLAAARLRKHKPRLDATSEELKRNREMVRQVRAEMRAPEAVEPPATTVAPPLRQPPAVVYRPGEGAPGPHGPHAPAGELSRD